MLKDITIQNFRGINELTVEDFGRVNLLVGGNNGGKTSVLEAVLLVAHPEFRVFPFLLNARRRRRFTFVDFLETQKLDKEDWHYLTDLFQNTEHPIKIKATIQQESRELELSLAYTEGLKGQDISRLDTSYSINGETHTNSIRRGQDLPPAKKPKYEIILDIVSPYFSKELKDYLSEVQNTPNRLQTLIVLLRQAFPSLSTLEDLRLNFDGMIMCNLGANQLFNLSAMGDGFISALSILLSLMTTPNGITLIDEIDTGLHYSVMVDMWKAVLLTAKENNTQIFTTTHSDECITALSKAYDAVWKDKEEDEIRLYRIQKNETGSKTRAVPYSGEDIKTNIANHWEVR